jgi:uncharacterized protein YndB with AHSA1/START domain
MNDRLGTVTRCYTVTFDRHSKHSPARLWAAITRSEEVSAWMGHPATVDLRVGGAWHVDFGRTGEGELPGVIVRVEPEQVLSYAWGLSLCQWTIAPAGAGCDFTFVHAGLAFRDIDDDEGLAAGWHSFLDRLDLHLDGRDMSEPERQARWNALKPDYRKLLDAAKG